MSRLSIVTSFACVLLAGCQSATPHSPPQGPPPVPVKLAVVEKGAVEDFSSYLATLKSRRSVEVRPQVSGQISQISVRSGSTVKKGDSLLEIDSAKQEATVSGLVSAGESYKQEKANAAETLKSLAATKLSKIAQMEFCQRQVERYNELLSQGAVSREALDQHEANLKVIKAELTGVDAQMKGQEASIAKYDRQIEQSQAQLKEQRAQLAYYKVLAPFPGVVGDVPVKIGEYVTPDTVLTSIDERGQLEVYINIPADDAFKLKKDLEVKILDGEKNEIASGRIFFISPQIHASDQSVLVKALISDTDRQLRSGQLVSSKIIWDHGDKLLVPTVAVSHLSGQDFVFVATGEGRDLKARQKPVKVGEIRGDAFIVKEGLNPADKVVVSGVQNMVDGAPIAPQP